MKIETLLATLIGGSRRTLILGSAVWAFPDISNAAKNTVTIGDVFDAGEVDNIIAALTVPEAVFAGIFWTQFLQADWTL